MRAAQAQLGEPASLAAHVRACSAIARVDAGRRARGLSIAVSASSSDSAPRSDGERVRVAALVERAHALPRAAARRRRVVWRARCRRSRATRRAAARRARSAGAQRRSSAGLRPARAATRARRARAPRSVPALPARPARVAGVAARSSVRGARPPRQREHARRTLRAWRRATRRYRAFRGAAQRGTLADARSLALPASLDSRSSALSVGCPRRGSRARVRPGL